MIINEADKNRLEDFFKYFFDFLDSKISNKTYVNESRHDPAKFIERIDGLILPAEIEAPFVLDEEFKVFITENMSKFMKMMYENVSSQIFGFAERPLYEYVVTWGFIFISPGIDEKHLNRLKALLFAGHYKFVEHNEKALGIYLSKKLKYLTDKDLEHLNKPDNGSAFFDYQWKVAVGIRNHYGKDRFESFLGGKNIGFPQIFAHQSMRVHGNPLSINETVNNSEVANRHLLLLTYYALQIMEYFKGEDHDGYDKVLYRYEKFKKNNKIRLD